MTLTPLVQTTAKWLLFHLVFYCIVALLIPVMLTASAHAADEHDDKIIYTLIGASRRAPECRRPYTLVIYPTGRVVYEGRNCVCQIGVRQFSIPEETAQKWISDLVGAGFLEISKNPPTPADAGLHELRLHKEGRSNTLIFSYSSFRLPRSISEVVREIHRTIRPNDRWARITDGKVCDANGGNEQ